MKLNYVYPDNDEDRLFKKVEEFMKVKYPHSTIRNILLQKDLILVRTEIGYISFSRGDFNESKD